MSNPTSKSSDASPVKIKAPKELPKVSLVNESLKKLKFHLARFDNVVKIRTTPDARTKGEWGFEHTKAIFNKEIIPFLKSLKYIFNVFDKDLLNEIIEVQIVFDQMDAAVQQSSVDKQYVLLTVMNSMSLNGESVNMERKQNESCDKCFNLDAELLKSQNAHNDLFKKFFEHNNLKAQLQDKDTTICKLKEIIKSMRKKSKEENVNYDYCEIETKNMELENSVAKLLSENEHLCKEINHVKQVFKEQFDSIKKTHVCTKEQSNSVIDKLNLKSTENEDLKAQIQDKVFVLTSLKNDLRKVKGKEIVDIAAKIPSSNTIVLGMFKLDLEPLAPRLLQNREAHIDYLKYTEEQADIFWEIVEQAKARQPLDKELDFACKHAQQIQELLVYVRDTCTNAIKLSAKKVESSTTSDSNTPMLSPTGLKCSTSNFGSKPTGNKKNDRISITSANIVPPKKTASHSIETQKPELKVYSRKPTNVKNVGSNKKAKIVESKNANHSEPNYTWRSNATDIPSSSSLVMTSCPDCTVRFGNNHIARIIGYGDYQLGNVTISRVYYLSHLNFSTLNKLAKDGLARGIPRLKFQKDHLCSACSLGKGQKDEAPDAIIKCIKNNQVRLNAIVHNVRIDNGTEFVNQTLHEFYENVGISHQTSGARTPQQNGVVESSGPELHPMTHATPSSGLVPNTVSLQPFQEAVAPRATVLANSLVSTSIDQDALSLSAVDPTLFTWQAGNDLLLVQIYVDDIIYASTNTAMCNEFANQMTTKFKMSMMGHMSFFLGLQISHSPSDMFINQSKYASEIVKKYGLLTTDFVDTPLVEKSKLDKDLQGKQIDATLYRGMIGSLMYLTSSRPDLIYAFCLCARYQAKPTKKHLLVVK
ncbi:retrovirus-related pol polyprotein from transposon TNT 1-94 [Tanacetum coccineum]